MERQEVSVTGVSHVDLYKLMGIQEESETKVNHDAFHKLLMERQEASVIEVSHVYL